MTVEARIPRFVLAELNTHRQFSRNSASSRAIPSARMLRVLASDPYVPDEWPANGPGMSPAGCLGEDASERAERVWRDALESAVRHARSLKVLGVHKEIANRLLEPFLWHTVLITATDWSNFLAQRCDRATSRPLRLTALAIRDAIANSTPSPCALGGWHLPLIQDDERGLPPANLVKISVARCARVSYLTHAGVRDVAEDLALYARLLRGGHMSPFEHVATPLASADAASGNFRGWAQHRKSIPFEHDFGLALASRKE